MESAESRESVEVCDDEDGHQSINVGIADGNLNSTLAKTDGVLLT